MDMAPRTLGVESAEACSGPAGEYEAWTHHLDGFGRAVFNKFSLGSLKNHRIEQIVHGSGISDPFAILGLIEAGGSESARLKNLGMPAVTSLVRVCNLKNHQDGGRSEQLGEGRLEAAVRVVWIPERAGQIAVRADMRLNHKGIGYAARANKHGHGRAPLVEPVVSAPLTSEEAAYAKEFGIGRVVLGLPSDDNHRVFVAVHPPLGALSSIEGGTLEQVYTPEPGHIDSAARTPMLEQYDNNGGYR
jgi:hypothetical protein